MPLSTGHPLVDVGLATVTAFDGKKRPEDLNKQDFDAIADLHGLELRGKPTEVVSDHGIIG
ncbi:MAG: hypothetical protein JRJ12_16205 [Deltaproteobacteria bacterium]|nr:hypothetical protein [Deltaproteobacteria bacterium]MBW2071430.1 hypothetical protein [Deltaproteobacteria bacterium]